MFALSASLTWGFENAPGQGQNRLGYGERTDGRGGNWESGHGGSGHG